MRLAPERYRTPLRSPQLALRGLHLGTVICFGIVGIGVALRLWAYARNASLWGDEAMLALNLLKRSPGELLEPLDWNQGAPLGYLLVCKGFIALFGGSEWVLRLPSFLAGLVGFALFVLLAFRLLPRSSALVAVVLFALAPQLIGYSAEAKQYELDATLSIALLTLGQSFWRDECSKLRLLALALGGACALWFSHPALFVLGGIGLAGLANALMQRDGLLLRTRLIVGFVWLVSFAVCYGLFLRKLGGNSYLLEYWTGRFLPFPPRSPGDLAWIMHQCFEFFDSPGGFRSATIPAGGFALFCAVLGGMRLAREDRFTLVALVLPLGLALLASGVKAYPFAGRLLLFAVPGMLLLVARGALLLRERFGAIVVFGCLFVAPFFGCYELLKQPLHAEQAREALTFLHAQRQEGDRVLIGNGARPTFAYYRESSPVPESAVQYLKEFRRDEVLVVPQLSGRVWVLLSHFRDTEEIALRSALDARGRRLDRVRFVDALVLLYEFPSPDE